MYCVGRAKWMTAIPFCKDESFVTKFALAMSKQKPEVAEMPVRESARKGKSRYGSADNMFPTFYIQALF